MSFRIEPMSEEDWPQIREIYREGIETGHATFELEPPAWEKWNGAHRKDCRLVAREGKNVLGWAAVSPVSARRVYAGVAEVSVYVGAAARGAGVGKALLTELVAESERYRIWTLQAGIFPENLPSLRLHESCGFRRLGVRERPGQMNGVWRDVVLMERRSRSVGV
jgi:L-amino acid N-acyltransferase YncA